MKNLTSRMIYPLILTGTIIISATGCKKDDGPKSGPSVTDADGNVYHSVVIGTQVWMVENLCTTKYNDNSSITRVADNNVWGTMTTEAYCWFNNDSTSNKNPYGALYNWYSVNTGKLCPAGWHVPSDSEWTAMITYLGGDSIAGGKLKESGTSHWITPNSNATNSSGFTALPAGSHYTNGSFYLLGKYGWLWSSTKSTSDEAWHPYMIYTSGAIYRVSGSKSMGFSVRCLKD